MNLDDAIAAHAEWKMKLRFAIQRKEQLDVSIISLDNKCPFGQWLHGDAKTKYGKLAGYTTCVAKHSEFHRCAGNVAQTINAGKYTEAKAMMGNDTPFAAASSDVGVAIIRLRKEARI